MFVFIVKGYFVNANGDGSDSCNGGYVFNPAVSPSGRCVNAFWLCCGRNAVCGSVAAATRGGGDAGVRQS